MPYFISIVEGACETNSSDEGTRSENVFCEANLLSNPPATSKDASVAVKPPGDFCGPARRPAELEVKIMGNQGIQG